MRSEVELADYFQIKSDKVELLCRICLTEHTENSVSLFDTQDNLTLSEKVMLCTRVHIFKSDSFPSHICEHCFKELLIADGFRIKCEESDSVLRKVLQKFSSAIKSDSVPDDANGDVGSAQHDSYGSDADVLNGIKVETETNDDTILFIVSDKNKKAKKKRIASKRKQLIEQLEESLEIKVEEEYEPSDPAPSDHSTFDCDLEKGNRRAKRKSKAADGKPKHFSCHICNKPLSSQLGLERHIQNMHSEEKFQKYGKVTGYGAERRFHCPDCDYKTKRRQAILYHFNTHTGAKPFKCDTCERSFSQHGSLKSHQKTHSDKMYYTCAECGKQFKHREVYLSHKLVHSNERNHVCAICSKALKTLSALQVHMNRHNNVKNYTCESCGATFVTRVELRSHYRVHGIGAKNYHCNFCEYSSHAKRKLDIHLRRHAGDRTVSCEQCDHRCYTLPELRLHMRKHTKEQNYSCPECELKFRHSSSVNKHMLKAHGKKYKWGDCVERRTVK